MKKIVIIFSIIGMLFISCKKEYTCTCTATQTHSTNGFVDQWTEVHPMKVTKQDAENYCSKAEVTQELSDGGTGTYTTTRSCSLN